ncbi:Hypothetical protein FKW44_008853, partial [Caligus rogercresseyi]
GLVDTGCSQTIVRAGARKGWLVPSDKRIATMDGSLIECLGEVDVRLTVRDRTHSVRAI